ncbi:sugar phosphate isomerase/epimerase family protein [Nibricoccus sp. IMCC34717]|uniref:sugar phosphate isomerase/epimerase family protein n=1 Tax=Nibricoccus sp. IMCC34717 TaxID=3034021 RepID=UPI00384FBDE8
MNKLIYGTGVYPMIVALGGESNFLPAQADQIAEHARRGFESWEPFMNDPKDFTAVGEAIRKHGLRLDSFYANARLHEGDIDAALDTLERQARKAREFGATLLTTNPEPIRWGGTENKTDAQLRLQASALQRLGERLAPLGMRVAYHFHDPEFRCGAREVHHMLRHTDPKLMGICFDTHWAFRGAGDSQEALFDLLEMYGDRIVSFHLRQSQGGAWTEVFGEGDIDHRRWAAWVKKTGWSGPLLLEQSWENTTVRTGKDILTAQAEGLAYLKSLFT